MANEAEKKMKHVILEKEAGRVVIDEEVVAKVAAIAAADTEGVISLGDNLVREQIPKLSRGALAKAVKVEIENNEVTVYLSINIDFGYSIHKTSAKVQERVEMNVENMIGYKVRQVNIKIAGVVMKA